MKLVIEFHGARFEVESGQWGEGLKWWARATVEPAYTDEPVEVGGFDTFGAALEALIGAVGERYDTDLS
jgi:hypothetical protein